MSRIAWCVLLGACSFQPNNEATGADAAGTGIDAAAGVTCIGPAGPWQVCIQPPSENKALPAMIDTSTSPDCLQAQPTGWTSAQPAACFIVGATIDVPGATIVTGTRPLVLVATGAITVGGILDVSSHIGAGTGPGSPGAPCAAGGSPVAGGNAGGGGAGGSFQSAGGDGGKGDDDQVAGGSAGSAQTSFAQLRAGCPGQVGGGPGGVAGAGGGAVYLVSATSIQVTGSILASGAGANGANASGGSGGGSGGMIVLHAPAIQQGTLIANGGGGAGGGAEDAAGQPGRDPLVASTAAAGGAGADQAGAGGDGQVDVMAGKKGGGTKNHGNVGGGGGGGGAGYIQANLTLPASSTVSPPVISVP